MLKIKCALCEKLHDAEIAGGVCLVCRKDFCGNCSNYILARHRRECVDCEQQYTLRKLFEKGRKYRRQARKDFPPTERIPERGVRGT